MISTVTIVAAAGIAVGDIAVAVPAPGTHADDLDFVMQLDDNGVYYDSISDIIDTGKLVCRSLRSGGNGLTAVSGYNAAEARIIVQAARTNMCPDA
jgi:hypothetical protein